MEFAFELTDETGTGLSDLRSPIKLTFQRNTPPMGEPAIQIEDPAAALIHTALANGFPRLRGWLGDRLILNAPWAPMQEQATDLDTTDGTMSASFRGPSALLEQRYTLANVTVTAEDAGDIALSLLTDTITTYGPLGLRAGTRELTTSRDRTYQYKPVSDAISELATVDGGFDWEDAPIDEGFVCGALNIYARQGTDLSTGPQAVVFEYGPGTIGNVQQVTRQTTMPVNRALVIGQNGTTGEKTDSFSYNKYGTCMVVVQASDVDVQATLDAQAQALLQPEPVKVLSFTPDPAVSPLPWVDFWLGDTVRFRARHGSINEDIAVRVNGITLDIDEDGNVNTMTLTIDQAVQ